MKNKNRGNIVNYMGYLFGIVTFLIVIFSIPGIYSIPTRTLIYCSLSYSSGFLLST